MALRIGGLGMGILAGAQTGRQTAPKVAVGKQFIAKTAAPSPGATAKNTTQKTSIGKGATPVKASQPSSFWTEQPDVDGDDTIGTRSATFGCRFDANGVWAATANNRTGEIGMDVAR